MEKEKKVADFMQSRPRNFSPTTPIREVTEIMMSESLSHVLITDEGEKVLGVVSKNDLLKYLLSLMKESSGRIYNDLEMGKSPISSIMTKTPISVSPDNTMEYALNLFSEYGFHCIPVLDDQGAALGIITFNDLVIGFACELAEDKAEYKFEHFSTGRWMYDYSWKN